MVTLGAVPARGLNDATTAERRRILELMARSGIDGVLQADHVTFRDGRGTDAIVMMAGLSGLQPDLGLHIGVYLLPLRHPVTVARSLATLAQLAPGRIVFGVGIGGEDRHEIEVCGVDPSTRGRRCDESLLVLRALLDGESVDFDGEFFHIDACRIEPVPDPRITVLVGGRSDAAIARAGRHGDGWLGTWCSSQRFARAIDDCAQAAARAGREMPRWRHKLQVWVGLDEDRRSARAAIEREMYSFYGLEFGLFEKYSPTGTPADVAEFLADYVDVGVEEFDLCLCGDDLDATIEMAGEVKTLLAAR